MGRSNVGKSSLLNALVRRKALARVSQTPGKTRHLNVYALPTCYLVDLPGYGWARAAKSDRLAYRKLVETYLHRRRPLCGVVWLLDIRHPPSRDDLDMQDLLVTTGRPVLPVLTKADKLTQARRHTAIQARANDLGLTADALLPVSSHSGLGVAELAASIMGVIEESGG